MNIGEKQEKMVTVYPSAGISNQFLYSVDAVAIAALAFCLVFLFLKKGMEKTNERKEE